MGVKNIVMAAAGTGDKTYIEDVFSTYLYTGNGSTQTINNGIDLAGKGGMVWLKARGTPSASAGWHTLYDTARGVTKPIYSNSDNAQDTVANTVTSFNSNGFTHGSTWYGENGLNVASWTFRKAPKFFDVVTYTGNGAVSQAISHSLGIKPGMVIIKRLDTTSDWLVRHASDNYVKLNLTNQGYSYNLNGSIGINSTNTFYVSAGQIGMSETNASGGQYVAYLFAHDTSIDGLIQCGKFTHSSDTDLVDLGWEPQYVLVKPVSTSGDWQVYDNMRGMDVQGSQILRTNTSGVETANTVDASACIVPDAKGFYHKQFGFNTYIYMAIRRGPMRTPTDGTKVYNAVYPVTAGKPPSQNNFGFVVDWYPIQHRTGTANSFVWSRLTGGNYLRTTTTDAEVSATNIGFDSNTGVRIDATGTDYMSWGFQRAPGFFDVVCYTGTGNAQTINHNLGVAPELIIAKRRDSATNWIVYNSKASSPNDSYLMLNQNYALGSLYNAWATPTSSTFGIATNGFLANQSGSFNVAYLFASCPGVSKVGSYTGNGTTQNIECGFTNGARFVLIKRTDNIGDWLVFDTIRGINAGNDPALRVNTTDAEFSNLDIIDPYAGGFSLAPSGASNLTGATFIYLAIA